MSWGSVGDGIRSLCLLACIPGLILVDCITEDLAEWLRILVPKLKEWKGVGLSTWAGDDIPGVTGSQSRSDEVTI